MARSSDDFELADGLVMAAIRLTRTLRALNKSSALSGPQISALAAIVYSERIAARDLAKLEEVTPATISKLVGGMEAEGLIQREADNRDSRLQWITATRKGKSLVVEGHAKRLAPLADAIKSLKRNERAELSAAIALIEALTKSASAGRLLE